MADTIQSSSSLPLPSYQTSKGTLDPLPLNGPEQSARDDTVATIQSQSSSTDDFESYLNQAAILQVEKDHADQSYDTATAIQNSSVYKPPGTSGPV